MTRKLVTFSCPWGLYRPRRMNGRQNPLGNRVEKPVSPWQDRRRPTDLPHVAAASAGKSAEAAWPPSRAGCPPGRVAKWALCSALLSRPTSRQGHPASRSGRPGRGTPRLQWLLVHLQHDPRRSPEPLRISSLICRPRRHEDAALGGSLHLTRFCAAASSLPL